jgi:Family of unknown function (DUF5752)
MNHNEPFDFYTERRLVLLTGLSARNLAELREYVRTVPGSSIFYHTHQMYLSHHFETPAFSNDFALWVSEALQNETLAEKLAAVDLLSFSSIRDLREALLATMENHAAGQEGPGRECPPGDEFHFCRSKSFMMRTGLIAHDPKEFFELLPEVSNVSLFFHFFEARLRLERPTNDFSHWLAGRGEAALAAAIERMDPYAVTLDELRDRIVALKGTTTARQVNE